jgi:hypothetical protein
MEAGFAASLHYIYDWLITAIYLKLFFITFNHTTSSFMKAHFAPFLHYIYDEVVIVIYLKLFSITFNHTTSIEFRLCTCNALQLWLIFYCNLFEIISYYIQSHIIFFYESRLCTCIKLISTLYYACEDGQSFTSARLVKILNPDSLPNSAFHSWLELKAMQIAVLYSDIFCKLSVAFDRFIRSHWTTLQSVELGVWYCHMHSGCDNFKVISCISRGPQKINETWIH